MTDKARRQKEGKYLTFTLQEETYGISILKVKEIIGMMKITSLPRFKDHFKGVINLRDAVIPIIDLRLLFGLSEQKASERTCIIVVEIAQSSRLTRTGIIVDEVSEVLSISEAQIEDPPRLGLLDVEETLLLGMAKLEGSVKILLDIDRILAGEDLELLREAV